MSHTDFLNIPNQKLSMVYMMLKVEKFIAKTFNVLTTFLNILEKNGWKTEKKSVNNIRDLMPQLLEINEL